MTDVVKADENLFLALGFPPYEAEILQLRTDLMVRLRIWIDDKQLTQTQAAEILGITQARVSDLVRGHWKKFSLDMLLTLAGKAGIRFKVTLGEAA
ncbi:MAG: XRE family transcriptional regulator [Methylovulum sp.]|nr:XRE family transcriptional regulator [Methylovulum sp.]